MKPLRLAIIGNYLPDRQESMLRYGAMMASALSAEDTEVSYHAPSPALGGLSSRPSMLAKWLGYVDKFLLFPFAVMRLAARADAVLVCDHSNSLYCRFTRGTPTVLTCHDMLAVRAAAGEFPNHRPGFTGRCLQAMIRSSMGHADHIVCVSAATLGDVRRLVGDVPTTIIANPLHHDYRPMPPEEVQRSLARFGLAGRSYFLHVGGNQWYKNRLGVVALFAALAEDAEYRYHRLAFAGKPLSADVAHEVERRGLRDRVDLVEAPDNATLNALYCGAEALLFPSLQEGFGWPIVEAQAAGCVVVTSDRAPMRDVAGPGGAILVDPFDAGTAAVTYRAARGDHDRYRAQGFSNAKRLDRAELASRYRAVIAALAAKGAV